MTFEFSLDEEDYFMLNYYFTSKDPATRSRMVKSRWILLGLYLILAAILYLPGFLLADLTFIIFAGLSFIFYPFYQKWLIRKNIRNLVNQNFKEIPHQSQKVILDESEIISETKAGQSKYKLEQVKSIHETGKHFFIMMKTGNCFTLPKTRIEDREMLEDGIGYISEMTGISINRELNWSW